MSTDAELATRYRRVFPSFLTPYYPEPISFAKTYRKTLADPHFLVRIA